MSETIYNIILILLGLCVLIITVASAYFIYKLGKDL